MLLASSLLRDFCTCAWIHLELATAGVGGRSVTGKDFIITGEKQGLNRISRCRKFGFMPMTRPAPMMPWFRWIFNELCLALV